MIASTLASATGRFSISPTRNSTFATPAFARFARARSSMAGVMSTPITRPSGPTSRAARKQSMPAPLPRSSTASPGASCACASGLPQPRPRSEPSGTAARCASLYPSAASAAWSPGSAAQQPQPQLPPSATAAYFSRTVARGSEPAVSVSRAGASVSTAPAAAVFAPPQQSSPQQAVAGGSVSVEMLRFWDTAGLLWGSPDDDRLVWLVGRRQRSGQHLESAKGLGVHAVAGAGPVHFALDEAGLLQDLEVLRDRGLGERQHAHDLAAHARARGREVPDDGHARRVGEGPGERGELLVRFGDDAGLDVGRWGHGGSSWIYRISQMNDMMTGARPRFKPISAEPGQWTQPAAAQRIMKVMSLAGQRPPGFQTGPPLTLRGIGTILASLPPRLGQKGSGGVFLLGLGRFGPPARLLYSRAHPDSHATPAAPPRRLPLPGRAGR